MVALTCYMQTVKGQIGQHTDAVWPQGYKTFFMLNSTEHEIFHAKKSQIINTANFFCC